MLPVTDLAAANHKFLRLKVYASLATTRSNSSSREIIIEVTQIEFRTS